MRIHVQNEWCWLTPGRWIGWKWKRRRDDCSSGDWPEPLSRLGITVRGTTAFWRSGHIAANISRGIGGASSGTKVSWHGTPCNFIMTVCLLWSLKRCCCWYHYLARATTKAYWFCITCQSLHHCMSDHLKLSRDYSFRHVMSHWCYSIPTRNT